jgi:hypothetical protein
MYGVVTVSEDKKDVSHEESTKCLHVLDGDGVQHVLSSHLHVMKSEAKNFLCFV